MYYVSIKTAWKYWPGNIGLAFEVIVVVTLVFYLFHKAD